MRLWDVGVQVRADPCGLWLSGFLEEEARTRVLEGWWKEDLGEFDFGAGITWGDVWIQHGQEPGSGEVEVPFREYRPAY